MLLTYLSIGEAEDYRAYWQDGNWNTSPPDYLLGENPNWPGNYSVEFWDENWQEIIYARVDEAIDLGYNGMYLDIVDAYEVAQVQNAYPGNNEQLREEMIDFVIELSDYAKGQQSDFLVVPQNAVGLLALDEANPDPNDPDTANKAYLDAIDGLGVEDLWYNSNRKSGWTDGDLEFIQYALNDGKFVLATSYPTNDAKQDTFVTNAINAGLIPFVANRNLTGTIDPVNNTIEAAMAGHNINVPWSTSGGGDSTAILVQENTTAVTTVTATDPDGGQTLTYTIVDDGADDAARFTINPMSGELTFVDAPDFEDPMDADQNNVYDVSVRVLGEGQQELEEQVLHVYVTDVPGTTYRGDSQPNIHTGSPESDTLIGKGGNDTLSGLAGNDTLKGGGGVDLLEGGDGDDVINGNGGVDNLIGGEGDDFLTGGGGRDVLTGGAGLDTFVYASTGQIGNKADVTLRELITDFLSASDDPLDHDLLDLTTIDANKAVGGDQDFVLLAENAALSGAGQLRWYYDDALGQTVVEGNVNANVAPDFRLNLSGEVDLSANDFLL